MKYFLDTEFIEAFHKPVLGKRRHFIDLISIGIVAEDGREYFAISNEYQYKDASDWVKQNVIMPLYVKTVHGDAHNHFDVHNFHLHYGKSTQQITQDIIKFVNPFMDGLYSLDARSQEYKTIHNVKDFKDYNVEWLSDRSEWAQPEFYGYYADYDWVLFCSLFGTMMDLPKGFPMYCKDLKQILDGRVRSAYCVGESSPEFDAALNRLKRDIRFPEECNEHDALEDARWIKKLYEFL